MFYTRALFASLITLTALLVPAVSFAQTAASSTPVIVSISTSTQASMPGQVISAPHIDPYSSADVEVAVRGYFADVPVMAAIAKCESNFRQYDSSNAVLNGGSGGMIGVFQINKSVHAKFALSLGDDITTLAGNMAYARYLYTQEGTAPWDSSRSCWDKITLAAAASSTIAMITDAILPGVAHASTLASTTATAVPAKATAVSLLLSSNLKLGSTGAQVAILQKLLNADGYLVAKSGAGSPGHETQKFGAATQAAVQHFQCAQNIACKGTPATTGYGFVGPKTRMVLMLNA